MANFINLDITKQGGNDADFSQLFNPDKMERIRLNSAEDGILFKYEGEDYESDSISDLAGLQALINTGAPVGGATAVLIYDPSANTGERTIAAHDLLDTNGNVFYLPSNTRIIESYYIVVTTFTSATDAGTISFGIETDDVAGLKAATAISTGTTYDDTGAPVAGIQTGAAANASEVTTAARTIQATVAVEALTAGKLLWVIRYVTLPVAA